MGPDSGAYKVVLVLHLMAVIIGFGGVVVTGYFGAVAARQKGREGAAIGGAVEKGYSFSEWFIYAVPVLGIVLILMSDDVFAFSQAWVGLSLLLYLVGIGLFHGLHRPTVRRINAILKETAGGSQASAAELDKLGAKAGMVGGLLNLITVAVVILMVFKPGFP
ncbi:MAG: putative integral rane protein [Actinomycetota bacterium]|jgi:uncharacterized membrane protein|nr:putative integral rane protein [Actinomycetota bacterium]